MLHSFPGNSHTFPGKTGEPLARLLTQAAGLLAAAALAVVLLNLPQQSPAATSIGQDGPVSGSAQSVQGALAADAPAFVVTKGQKG